MVVWTMNALKRDNGKLPIGLIPRSAIEAEAAVMAFGAGKYHADNWRQGFAWRRLIDAALRHVHAIADGEDIDPESGLLHAAHARCCLGFLIEHMARGLGVDDRYRRGPVEPLALEQPGPCMTPEEIRRWIDQHVRDIPGE
jgi:hypothetical protein